MLLTVVMPVYNASQYLAEAIESVLNQTYKDFVFVILNDNSSDNSLEIIRKFSIRDKRIVIHDFKENKGPAFLRNLAIKEAMTKYIALMDADDISMLSRFEIQIDFLEKNENIGLCGSWFTLFGTNITSRISKHYETHEELKPHFLTDCFIGNPSTVFRKEIMTDNFFDKEYHPLDDYELWSRIIYQTQFYNIQKSLLMYRWHEKNISHDTKVNITSLHRKIRFNQLKALDIEGDLNTNLVYLKALKFEEKVNFRNVSPIIEAGKELIETNKIKKVYNSIYFNKIIIDNLIATLLQSKKYDPFLLLKLHKQYAFLFSQFNFKQRFRLYRKCLLFSSK